MIKKKTTKSKEQTEYEVILDLTIHTRKVNIEDNFMTNKEIIAKVAKLKKEGVLYAFVNVLGLKIITKCSNSIPGVSFEEIKEKLGDKRYKIFAELYGSQTCGMNGPYVYDVEAVLVRMFTGNLEGTQLFFD